MRAARVGRIQKSGYYIQATRENCDAFGVGSLGPESDDARRGSVGFRPALSVAFSDRRPGGVACMLASERHAARWSRSPDRTPPTPNVAARGSWPSRRFRLAKRSPNVTRA
eukprot:6852812-Prymnesium_polylepis.1